LQGCKFDQAQDSLIVHEIISSGAVVLTGHKTDNFEATFSLTETIEILKE
jgi:hypothetical protein